MLFIYILTLVFLTVLINLMYASGIKNIVWFLLVICDFFLAILIGVEIAKLLF